MSQFLGMGGYAWYVWMSYGMVALAVIVEMVVVRVNRRHALAAARSVAVTVPAPPPRFDPARTA